MKELLNRDIAPLIIGSTFFGTGGGGTPAEAAEIYRDLFEHRSALPLAELTDFDDTGVFVSAFGVGSAAGRADVAAVTSAFDALAQHLKTSIRGVVPVEIGPKSIATACFLSAGLGVPTLDADIVGGRSTPEVFLETITLFDLPRTPLAVANERGEVALLTANVGPREEETFLRDFATRSGVQAYVVGYPLTRREIERAIETNTVTAALDVGRLIMKGDRNGLTDSYGVRTIFTGTIDTIEKRDTPGFLSFDAVITNGADTARLFVKNENLLVWKNDELALSCPDLIVVLDRTGRPLYNTELRPGIPVEIVGAPAAPRWQTAAGRALFNPRTFGFDLAPTLLT
ncbi:MAG: hypothetical protein RL417_183 [Pseudomonadota bacterium]|jgi:DUF917 family protein